MACHTVINKVILLDLINIAGFNCYYSIVVLFGSRRSDGHRADGLFSVIAQVQLLTDALLFAGENIDNKIRYGAGFNQALYCHLSMLKCAVDILQLVDKFRPADSQLVLSEKLQVAGLVVAGEITTGIANCSFIATTRWLFTDRSPTTLAQFEFKFFLITKITLKSCIMLHLFF